MHKILAILFFLHSLTNFAQGYNLQAYATGGEDDIYTLKNMANSKDGCFYTCGTFFTTFTFAGNTLNSSYYNAVYIAKFDYNASLVWIKKIAESNNTINKLAIRVTTDTSGNIIAGINFTDKLFFYGDSTVLSGADRVELIKIDSAGIKLWTYNIPGNRLGNKGLIVDQQNNLLVTGDTSDQLFVRKYDTDCNLIWSRNAGGPTNPDYGFFIDIDSLNNIYVAGMLSPSGSVYFDTLHVTFPGGVFNASFIAKYNPAGKIQWVRYVYSQTFGSYTTISAIKCFNNGNIVVTGGYGETLLRFSNGYSSIGPNPSGFIAGFLAAFDNSGNRLWAKKPHNNFGGDDGGANRLIVDNSAILMINMFDGTVANAFDTIVSNGNYDLLLEKFDVNGNLLSYAHAGGTGIDLCQDYFYSGNALFLSGSTGSHPFNVETDSFNPSFANNACILKLHDNTIGISENKTAQSLFVYPNPSKGEFTLQLPQQACTVYLTDTSGKILFRTKSVEGQKTMPVKQTGLQNGIYLLHVTCNNFTATQKLVIGN